MKKFLVTYHAPVSFHEKMRNATPEVHQKMIQAWMSWAQENKSNLVDFGTPLANGKSLSKDGTSPGNKELSGYFIFQAESIDEAVILLKNHPHLLSDDSCTLEIHELMPLPNM
ncbi:MAG: hypothetical protein KAX33_07695 [Candidatus Lokiarchaeota archaeon]|nr:hypothetical protein [Candidatus Heimdallarchaeota archaeon]MCG3254824.1 hypothetical protein [Candidatus Heimdallarchaeota archaeon]MCK4238985.1 hypothetical protein [Candidatus Lokiarchaeota archaeon]MCK4609901.1 hypothetical protein [Candidatus Heimdallarchaeota archaeon]